MTQAYNLAILANAVDTSGRLNVGTNATGTLPLANGGTGTTNTVNSIVAGTGITTSVAGTAVTINATGTGTVTSVATGNGLQGGTITTTGTLSVACPTYNTVGSYSNIMLAWGGGAVGNPTSGSNYAAGGGNGQARSACLTIYPCSNLSIFQANILSGTWKWMGPTTFWAGDATSNFGLGCRVS